MSKKITGEIGDDVDAASIGLQNKQFIQYFGPIDKNTPKEDLAALLSLALFGNDAIDFAGVINEIRLLKNTNKRLHEKLEILQNGQNVLHTGQEQRKIDSDTMKIHIVNLQDDMLNLKNQLTNSNKPKAYTYVQYILYIVLFIGSISSVLGFLLR